MTWETVPLSGLIRDVAVGFASSDDLDDGVFQIRMNNLTRESGWDWSRRRRVLPTPRQLEVASVRAGDVIFNATNSPELVGKSGLMPVIDEPAVISNHFMRLRPSVDLDSGYLSQWLRSQFQRGVFRARAKAWINQATVSREALLSLRIPLPPLTEQRRIAAILDEADALRSRSRENLTSSGRLSEAIYRMAVSDASSVPLKIVVPKITSGKSVVGSDDSDANARVLKISAVTSGELRTDQTKPLPAGYQPPPEHLIQSGDLLMSRANTAELVGASAYVWETPAQPLALPDKLWRLHVNPEIAHPLFVHAALSEPGLRHEISRRASGSGGSMKNIGQQAFLSISMRVPRLAIQREFARVATEVRSERARLEDRAITFDALFASLQHRAFRGEL